MVNTRNVVSLKDKKKAKNTVRMFGGISAFFLIASVLIGVFMPKAKEIKGIDNNEDEPLKTFTAGLNGDEFYTAGINRLQRYSTLDGELLETLNYASDIEKMCRDNGDITFTANSFLEPTLHYENDLNCLLVIDNDGNIFKYSDNGKNLSLSNDYFVTDRVTLIDQTKHENILFQQKSDLRSLTIKDHYLYGLFEYNNNFVVNVFDINDLSSGIKNSKTLYSLMNPTLDQKIEFGTDYIYLVEPVDSGKGENPYSLTVDDNYLYIFTSAGVNRWSLDFKDYNDINYIDAGKQNFAEVMRNELLALDNAQKTAYGIDDALLTNASEYVLTKIYMFIFGDEMYVFKQNQAAKAFALANDWLVSYTPKLKSGGLVIDDAFVDGNKNIAIKSSANHVIGGMTYSPKNNQVYYLNLLDKHIYYFSLSQLSTFDDVASARNLGDICVDSSISYRSYNFFDTRGNIGYDKNANTIHVTFFCSNKISVIDINGEVPSVRETFSFEYDIRAFIENKDATRLAAMFQTENRTITNEASYPLHISIVEPSAYKNHALIVVFLVVCIVLCLVAFVIMLVASKAHQREMTLLKLKVINRDLKRNKWTYIALIPFIAFLIMFCYVEAVGSISFSFFSYTLQKPSYIWNDFGNYIEIFNEKKFWLMMGNTLFFLVFDLFLGIVPPIIFAFFLSIIKSKKISGVLRALMFIPAIVPGIASLLIWRIGIFGDTGVLNQLICFLQTGSTSSDSYTPVKFLLDDSLSRWSLLLMGFPYVGGYLIFYGGLMNIPKEYDEACQLEGLGVFKRFFTIDLPLIKPQIKYIFVMGILSSVQNYERTYMLGSTGTTTLVESMYRQMKDVANPNYGLASAYATLIFILLLFPVLWNFRKTKKDSMGDML